MTTPSWPAGLPCAFTVNSFAEQGADNVIYSDVSIGPSKARRRTTAQPKSLSGTLVMTASQFAAFLGFLRDEIADGALTFMFPDQLGGPDRLVRLTGPYKASRTGAKIYLSIALDVMP